MVLAQIFREEGREEGYAEGYSEGIEIGRAEAGAESQAKIAELQELVKRLEAAKGKSQE